MWRWTNTQHLRTNTPTLGVFDKTNGVCWLMIGSWFRTNSTSGWTWEVWPFDLWPFDLWRVREAELAVWEESPLVDSQDNDALSLQYWHAPHNTQTLGGCWYNLQVNNGALVAQSVRDWAKEPQRRQNMVVNRPLSIAEWFCVSAVWWFNGSEPLPLWELGHEKSGNSSKIMRFNGNSSKKHHRGSKELQGSLQLWSNTTLFHPGNMNEKMKKLMVNQMFLMKPWWMPLQRSVIPPFMFALRTKSLLLAKKAKDEWKITRDMILPTEPRNEIFINWGVKPEHGNEKVTLCSWVDSFLTNVKLVNLQRTGQREAPSSQSCWSLADVAQRTHLNGRRFTFYKK